MARFRAEIQGNRGEASRLGSASSGMDVRAQSWSGDVHIFLKARGDEDHVAIVALSHGGTGPIGEIYNGPVAGLVEIIDLWKNRDQLNAVLALTEGK